VHDVDADIAFQKCLCGLQRAYVRRDDDAREGDVRELQGSMRVELKCRLK